MQDTPRANRLHIGLYGKRNAGKSSLINFITGQELAIVSDIPGTTADPVLKSMELLPIGPVVFIDTAGFDDTGVLGKKRVQKTKEMLDRTDLALLVISAEEVLDTHSESLWLVEFKKRKIPVLGILNQTDRLANHEELKKDLETTLGIPMISVSPKLGKGRGELLVGIIEHAPVDFEKTALVGDLLPLGATVVLVAPQDLQAPKGRLILPQVQTIRDILDYGGMALTVKEKELVSLLSNLKVQPDLIITDSQIFPQVRDLIGPDIPLTSFSILMARAKGDLGIFVEGARKIDQLVPNDRVLIAEACTHHAMEDDIGRVKIPNWLRRKIGDSLTIDFAMGQDFPVDLRQYSLIIHCGSCMLTRRQLMTRLAQAEAEQVSITNYGTAIAALNGMLEQVVMIFPEVNKNKKI